VYVRKFDWDEARRRHAAGETLAEIARDLGVTPNAVRFAVNDRARIRAELRASAWQMLGACPDCGARASRNGTDGQHRCTACAAKLKATSVRDRELQCMRCREWKHDNEFPFSRAEPQRRGRHKQCRPCQTEAKRAYRERRKVPCRQCGQPCLPAGEKGARRKDTGLCHSCWQASRKQAA
jgi:hypothetical protein